MSETHSVNDIRTAIRELSARADLARKEGRPDDAAELEQRIQGYRKELARLAALKRPAAETCCGGTRSAAHRGAP